MQRIVTGEEMRKLDGKTIEKLGIPALVLMERAAAESVNALQMWKEKAGHILVLAGTGNNGGDGLAVGRILLQKGFQVTVVLIGSREKLSEENRIQIRILENMGIPIKSKPEEKEYDIIAGGRIPEDCRVDQLRQGKGSPGVQPGYSFRNLFRYRKNSGMCCMRRYDGCLWICQEGRAS